MLITHVTPEHVKALLCQGMESPFPFYVFGSYDMPRPGPGVSALARRLTTGSKENGSAQGPEEIPDALYWVYLQMLYSSQFAIPVAVKHREYMVQTIPGHYWGGAVSGPRRLTQRPRIMIVGDQPREEDLSLRRNFSSHAGMLLGDALREVGFSPEEIHSMYVTNLIRWGAPHPSAKKPPVAWIKDCLPLLHQELRIVQPDIVLCLGALALKALCGPQALISQMMGRAVQQQVPVYDTNGGSRMHSFAVLAALDPQILKFAPERKSELVSTLQDLRTLATTGDLTQLEDYHLHYIYSARELRNVVDVMLSRPGLKRIAVDAEWHMPHPTEPGAYLRLVQFTDRRDYAAVVVFTHRGGVPAFVPDAAAAADELRRLLLHPEVQIIGSFFASDFPWLQANGVDLSEKLLAPMELEAFRGGDYPGLFDIALAYHAVDETADYKLEIMASRLCGAQRWDIDLLKWKKRFCLDNKIKEAELEGYGECPDDILLPYAGKDVVWTWRVAEVLREKLYADAFGNDCWRPFHTSMIAYPGFIEMGTVGVPADRERLEALTDNYIAIRKRLVDELQTAANWPKLNPRSQPQCVELLFGERYNRKRGPDGQPLRLRPEGAISLELTPLKAAGAKGQLWSKLVTRGEESLYSPSTDKEVCGILADKHPIVRMLRNVRIIDHILKSVLCPPLRNKDQTLALDDRSQRVYKKGHIRFICEDGRIRSSFSPVKETGRSASARPPMQNLCVDAETEFLTPSGWVFADQLQDNMQVMQYDAQTAETTFVVPEQVIRQPYTGAMVAIQHSTHNLLVTPQHRLLWRTKKHLYETTAEDIARELSFTPIDYFLYVGPEANPAQALNVEQKIETLWTLPLEARLNLARAVLRNSGMRRYQSHLFFKRREQVIDYYQLLFASCGFRAIKRKHKNNFMLRVEGKSGSLPKVKVLKHVTEQPFSGTVYCVTVPTSYVVVRRKGCIAITGNSKRREADYKKISGDAYKWPIRSFVTGGFDPVLNEPTVLMASDFSGAELFGLAVKCGSPTMLEHCRRSLLPDDHPDKYDIHSAVTCMAFRLDCPPTQKGLESVGKKHLRTAAKGVIFGLNYGQSAEGSARIAQQEGVDVTVEDAMLLQNALFHMYPEIRVLQEMLRQRVYDPGWLCNATGRYRRFSVPTMNEKVLKERERQFLNFPFQSEVADQISMAMAHLKRHPRKPVLRYNLVLQVHDELVLEVPVSSVEEVYDKIIPECMHDRLGFYACDLDGNPLANSPLHRFGVETSVFLRWGVTLTEDDCATLGLSPRFARS